MYLSAFINLWMNGCTVVIDTNSVNVIFLLGKLDTTELDITATTL